MERKREKAGLVIILAAAVSAIGCGAAAQYGAKRFYREAKGIKYDAFAAQPLQGDLSAYNRLVVEPLDNEMEDRIPPQLVASLDEQLFRQLSRVRHFQVVRGPQQSTERTEDVAVLNSDQAAGTSGEPLAQSSFLSESAAEPDRFDSRKQSVSPTAAAPHAVILRGSIVDFDAGKQSLRVLQAGVGRQAMLTLHLSFIDGANGHVLGKYVINSEVYRLGGKSSAGVDKLSAGVARLVAKLVEKQGPRGADRASWKKP
jgi:hypothetical protein